MEYRVIEGVRFRISARHRPDSDHEALSADQLQFKISNLSEEVVKIKKVHRKQSCTIFKKAGHLKASIRQLQYAQAFREGKLTPFCDEGVLAHFFYDCMSDQPWAFEDFSNLANECGISVMFRRRGLRFFRTFPHLFVTRDVPPHTLIFRADSHAIPPASGSDVKTESDVLAAVVAALSQKEERGKSVCVGHLMGLLPKLVRDLVRERWGGMANFAKSFPEHFGISRDEKTVKLR
jgi:hypothetical protein